jgi:hypothetical protein
MGGPIEEVGRENGIREMNSLWNPESQGDHVVSDEKIKAGGRRTETRFYEPRLV